MILFEILISLFELINHLAFFGEIDKKEVFFVKFRLYQTRHPWDLRAPRITKKKIGEKS